MSRQVFQTILACCLVAVVLSCRMPLGWRPPTTAEVIQRSDVVLLGNVRQTFEQGQSETRYIAEMQVHCVIKGPRVTPVVNITDAGYEPGLCTTVNLHPGKTYFVMVREGFDGDWQAKQEGTIELSPQSLNAVTAVCGLDIKYPLGLSAENTDFVCPIRTDDPMTCLYL